MKLATELLASHTVVTVPPCPRAHVSRGTSDTTVGRCYYCALLLPNVKMNQIQARLCKCPVKSLTASKLQSQSQGRKNTRSTHQGLGTWPSAHYTCWCLIIQVTLNATIPILFLFPFDGPGIKAEANEICPKVDREI